MRCLNILMKPFLLLCVVVSQVLFSTHAVAEKGEMASFCGTKCLAEMPCPYRCKTPKKGPYLIPDSCVTLVVEADNIQGEFALYPFDQIGLWVFAGSDSKSRQHPLIDLLNVVVINRVDSGYTGHKAQLLIAISKEQFQKLRAE